MHVEAAKLPFEVAPFMSDIPYSLELSAFQTRREKEAFTMAILVIGCSMHQFCPQESVQDFEKIAFAMMGDIGLDFTDLCRTGAATFLKKIVVETKYDA